MHLIFIIVYNVFCVAALQWIDYQFMVDTLKDFSSIIELSNVMRNAGEI